MPPYRRVGLTRASGDVVKLPPIDVYSFKEKNRERVVGTRVVEVQVQTDLTHYTPVCMFCQCPFENIQSLLAHLLLVKHDRDSVSCLRCRATKPKTTENTHWEFCQQHGCLRIKCIQIKSIIKKEIDPSIYTCLLCTNDPEKRAKSRRFESPLHLSVHILARHNLSRRGEHQCGLCLNFDPEVEDLETHLDRTHYREFELSSTLSRMRAGKQSSPISPFTCTLCEMIEPETSAENCNFKSGHSLQAHVLSRHCKTFDSNCTALHHFCHICAFNAFDSFASFEIAFSGKTVGVANQHDHSLSSCNARHGREMRYLKEKAESRGELPISLGDCWTHTCPLCWKRFDVANVHQSSKNASKKIVKPATAEARFQMHILTDHGASSMKMMRSVISAGSDLRALLETLLDCPLCLEKCLPHGLKHLFREHSATAASITSLLNEVYNARIRHLNEHARKVNRRQMKKSNP